MNNQEKLRQLLIENPELPIKFFYSSEGCDGYDYTLGGIHKVFVDKLGEYQDLLWLKNTDEDTLLETIENDVLFELYPDETRKVNPQFTVEQDSEINKRIQEEFDSIKWNEAIIVYVGL